MSTSILGVGKPELPSLRKFQAQPFRPFHCHEGTDCFGFLVFLQKEIVRCTGLFQPVKIQMDSRRIPVLVVLSKREGGAGDGLANA